MCSRRFESGDHGGSRELAAAADLLDALQHRSIARVAEFTQKGAQATLTVRPGGGLLLSQWRPADGAELASTMADVAEAVAYLHSEGVHMGGIRLGGVALLTDGRPVLVDSRRWRRTADHRLARADTASLGRALGRLLQVSQPSPPGWRQRLCATELRLGGIAAVARGAESGRLNGAEEMAARLTALGSGRPATVSWSRELPPQGS